MPNLTIVPAQPGYVVVYADGSELFLGDPVIAWAVEAGFMPENRFHAIAHPVTPNGDAAANYVGFQYPDGKVSIMDGLADSLEDAQRSWAESVQRGER